MKLKIGYILIIFILLYIYACDSIDEHSVSPYPQNINPSITLTADDSTIIVGNILSIHIHIENDVYYKGVIKFGDTHSIYLNSYVPIIDTSISYLYERSGTYNIVVEFHNDERTINKNVEIHVLRYLFDLTLSLDTYWKFDYNCGQTSYTDEWHQYGIHTWQVVSFSIENTDTIYSVRQIRDDLENHNGIITAVEDTSFFDIVFSGYSVRINWPLYYSIPAVQIVNHSYVSSYPIIIPPFPPFFPPNRYSVYDEKAGPIKYYYFWFTNHSYSQWEKFTLIEYYNP